MRPIAALSAVFLLALCAAPAAAADRDDVVRVVTEAYIEGVHAKPDPIAMRRGFHPEFRMLVLTDGKLNVVTLDEWAGRIAKAAADPTAAKYAIRHEIPQVDVIGSTATVKVELWRDDVHTFTDFLSLYKFADGWKIVGKTFHAHPRPGTR